MKPLLLIVEQICGAPSGEQRVSIELANLWSQLGHKVSIMSFDAVGSHAPSQLNPAISFEGLAPKNSLIRTHDEMRPSFLREVFRNSLRIIRLRRLFRDHDCDSLLILAFGTYRGLLCSIALMGAKSNLVICEHTNPNSIGRIWRFFRKLLYPRARKIVVLTKDSMELLPKSVSMRSVVIPNPVYPLTAGPVGSDQSQRFSPFALAVGRLYPMKRYDIMLEAFSRVSSQVPNFNLVIAGDGPLQAELVNLVRNYNLQSRVHFLGLVQNLKPFYENAEFLVSSSEYEAFPMAICEALSLSCPVVSTDCKTGPRDLISDTRNGLLVPVADVEALASAMLRMIEKPLERMKMKKEALRSIEKFSPEAISMHWKKLFSDLNSSH